ncbi:unnamed protein product [Clonostachys rosea]|uniref:Efflux pump antibiotic resistance protein n=1 Tax=Bionectria ochroleuca TaxID=29856 RepID=A0ABY6TV13_BIOOC|nr:unnamed protein product [Clonostachys rosea]
MAQCSSPSTKGLDANSDNGLKVINASLFRMGTKSMAEAFRILGLKTHHALDDTFKIPWHLVEQAAEGKWPNAPGARGGQKPFGREQWDSIWGSFDAVTDLASPFALDLARAYPETKVIVVQRDFESWWPSFESENIRWRFFPGADFLSGVMAFFNIRAGNALGLIYLGLFEARDLQEIHTNARRTYEQYFHRIREEIPEERRLEYRLGDGWEPLCGFLGKEVPDIPFPRVNERKQHKVKATSNFYRICLQLGWAMLPWAVAVAAVAYTAWFVLAAK